MDRELKFSQISSVTRPVPPRLLEIWKRFFVQTFKQSPVLALDQISRVSLLSDEQKLFSVEPRCNEAKRLVRSRLEILVQVTINHYNRPTRRHFYSRRRRTRRDCNDQNTAEGPGTRREVAEVAGAAREETRNNTRQTCNIVHRCVASLYFLFPFADSLTDL